MQQVDFDCLPSLALKKGGAHILCLPCSDPKYESDKVRRARYNLNHSELECKIWLWKYSLGYITEIWDFCLLVDFIDAKDFKKNYKRPKKEGKVKSKARHWESLNLISLTSQSDHLVLISHRFLYFLVSRSLRSKRPH